MIIPIEIFSLFIGLVMIFTVIGFWKKAPVFILVGGIMLFYLTMTTDSITINGFFESELPANYVYNQEAGSGLIDISAGATASDIRGEYVTNTASALYLQEIDCIDITLRKVGAPTGVVDIGVWDHAQAIGNPVIKAFGAQDLSVVSSSVSQWYSFCLPEGTTYTIGDQDVLGARYNAGDSLNAVRIQVSTVDIFDSTNSQSTAKADATDVWSQPTGDIVMRLYLRGESSTIVSNDFIFGSEIKILFALFASLVCLMGVLLYKFKD